MPNTPTHVNDEIRRVIRDLRALADSLDDVGLRPQGTHVLNLARDLSELRVIVVSKLAAANDFEREAM